MDFNEQKEYLKELATKSDRELLEMQTLFIRMTHDNSERIKNNVVYFFWLSLASIVGSIILLEQFR